MQNGITRTNDEEIFNNKHRLEKILHCLLLIQPLLVFILFCTFKAVPITLKIFIGYIVIIILLLKITILRKVILNPKKRFLNMMLYTLLSVLNVSTSLSVLFQVIYVHHFVTLQNKQDLIEIYLFEYFAYSLGTDPIILIIIILLITLFSLELGVILTRTHLPRLCRDNYSRQALPLANKGSTSVKHVGVPIKIKGMTFKTYKTILAISNKQADQERAGLSLHTQVKLSEELNTTRDRINNLMKRNIRPMMRDYEIKSYVELMDFLTIDDLST